MLAIPTITAPVNESSNTTLEAATEQQLLLSAREGNQAAYGEICQRHSKKILRIALRITRNYEDAEDALQECFLRAMIHIREFDGRSQFSTWLTRIAINAALMKIRRKQRYREVAIQTTAEFCEGQELIELVDHTLTPEGLYSEHEKVNILREAVTSLRPRIRSAIEIFHLEDRSLAETSRKLGVSPAATKGRLFQAKAVLRKSRLLKQLNPAGVRRAA